MIRKPGVPALGFAVYLKHPLKNVKVVLISVTSLYVFRQVSQHYCSRVLRYPRVNSISHSFQNHLRMKNRVATAFIFFSWCMMFVGCFTAKKGHRQTIKQYAKHPAVLANDCASLFPSRDSTHIEYKYVSSEPVITRDTVTSRDTISNIVYKTINTNTRIHDTVFLNKVIYQEDQRKLVAKDGVIHTKDEEISVLKEGNAKKTTQRNISLWFNGLLGLVVLGGIVIKRMRLF